MKNTKVRDVMTAHPILISPNTTLKDAAVRMREIDCGILPVGMENNVKGIITDRDIVVRAVSHSRNTDEEMVKDYMSEKMYHCHENDTLENVIDAMIDHEVSRLVVKNKAGKVTGIVSFGDIIWKGADSDDVVTIVKHALRTGQAR